jgi:peptidoglycan/LPS O-acetylase OafA/YrhL
MDLLLIIRGLAAISVVIWHTVGHEAGFPMVNIPGRTAVWIFFGISGYVISYGFLHRRYLLDGPGLKHFYLNRFLRIYPLFLLLSVLGWLTMWAGSGTNPLEWGDLPGQFFGLQFNHAYKLNSVFWTLGLEIQFYAIAPALAALFFISNVRWRWAIIAACYFGLLAFDWLAVRYMGWSVDGRNIVSVLPHFLVGMAGCGLVVSLKRGNMKAVGYLVGSLACLVASNWIYHMQPAWFWNKFGGAVLVDAMILLFIFAHASLHRTRGNSSRLTRSLL